MGIVGRRKVLKRVQQRWRKDDVEDGGQNRQRKEGIKMRSDR